jgi:hypothetical protein
MAAKLAKRANGKEQAGRDANFTFFSAAKAGENSGMKRNTGLKVRAARRQRPFSGRFAGCIDRYRLYLLFLEGTDGLWARREAAPFALP